MCSVDDWDSDGVRTPQAYFDALDARYNFAFDLFASLENKKCVACFTATDDALTREWPRLLTGDERLRGWLYANPPYSRGNLGLFVAKAISEAKAGSGIVALIPATPGTQWFNDFVLRRCDVLDAYTVDRGPISGYELSMQGIGYRQRVLFVKGRVPFEPPIGYPPEKSWNPPATDSVIIEWRPPL